MSDVREQRVGTSGQKDIWYSSGSEQDEETSKLKILKTNISQSRSLNIHPSLPAFTDALKTRSHTPFLRVQNEPEACLNKSMSRISSLKYQSDECPDVAFTRIHLENMRNISEAKDVNVTRSVSNLAGRRFDRLVAHMPGDSFSSGCIILQDRIKSVVDQKTSKQQQPQEGSVEVRLSEEDDGVELTNIPSTSDQDAASHGYSSQTQIPEALIAALNKRLYPVILNTYKEYVHTFGKKDQLTQQAKEKLSEMSKWVDGPTSKSVHT